MTCPPSLATERRWVLWRSHQKPDRPKPDKVPVSLSGVFVDRFDTSHWLTFDEAIVANRFDGIGFVLGDGFVGYDHDDCRDPQTGVITPDVWAVIAAFDSYTEITPSGKGIHVIMRGSIPGPRRRTNGHEIYDGQFFTFTGDHVPGTPDDVKARSDRIAAFYRRVFGDDPVQDDMPDYLRSHIGDTRGKERITPSDVWQPLTDEEIGRRILVSPQADKFIRLMRGDIAEYSHDRSAADMALAGILTYWCRGDVDQIERIARKSRLFRPKWDERRAHTTYLRYTIERAVRRG